MLFVKVMFSGLSIILLLCILFGVKQVGFSGPLFPRTYCVRLWFHKRADFMNLFNSENELVLSVIIVILKI